MTTKNAITLPDNFPDDLKRIARLVYVKCNFDLNNPVLHQESTSYGACSFELNQKKIQHRVSKITPTKSGQFVTIWKRDQEGITKAFAISDDLDYIFITSRSGENLGQFIFPKSVLAAKGIITQNNKEGKRGIRVYPPWDRTNSKQAEKTQLWQTDYFLDLKSEDSIDFEMIRKLFHQKI